MNPTQTNKAAFSIPSILSIIAAVFSFRQGAFFGLVLAGAAVVLGLLGLVLSLSPKTRGGIFSFLGVFGGALGVLAAIVKAILWVVHAG